MANLMSIDIDIARTIGGHLFLSRNYMQVAIVRMHCTINSPTHQLIHLLVKRYFAPLDAC